ncbi:hypothetical protein K32_02890 [Kaistia sp. 32K]|uniref:hypothetical protein n=1 Tax=Kaistia sp. 32K TaxID=2795690 RepID=UPI001916AE1F|nr:hypothetical protein [Kaistia sp. 32K]BCP51672.1 hypothetical protein K32_02890 [Kaistia sp. 32K]
MNSLKYTIAAAALVALFASPAIAQTSDNTGTGGQNGATSGMDPVKAQIKDEDVFGFDITQGAVGLTPEQLTAAKNTCNQNVTAEPLRYSAAVKTFCTQIQ